MHGFILFVFMYTVTPTVINGHKCVLFALYCLNLNDGIFSAAPQSTIYVVMHFDVNKLT